MLMLMIGCKDSESPGRVIAAVNEEGKNSVMLRWHPPVLNADGTALGDLSHFRLYRRPRGAVEWELMRDGIFDAEAEICVVPVGDWEFSVTAVDDSENESLMSNIETVRRE